LVIEAFSLYQTAM